MPTPAEGTLTTIHQLRVLTANERQHRLELLAGVGVGLGHEVRDAAGAPGDG